MKKTHLTIAFIISLFTTNIFAQIKYVTNATDIGQGSLRQVLGDATNNDTIIIDVKDTLKLGSALEITKNVTIIGPSPKHFTITTVSSNNFDDNGNGVIKFSDDLDSVKIVGIGFENAVSSSSIFNDFDDINKLTIQECLFENNLSRNKGGVFNVDDSVELIVSRCSFFGNKSKPDDFSNNTGDSQGGVLFLDKDIATVKFYNCTFSENRAFEGGAIKVDDGTLKLVNNTFFWNKLYKSSGEDSDTDQNIWSYKNPPNPNTTMVYNNFKDTTVRDEEGADIKINIDLSNPNDNGNLTSQFVIRNNVFISYFAKSNHNATNNSTEKPTVSYSSGIISYNNNNSSSNFSNIKYSDLTTYSIFNSVINHKYAPCVQIVNASANAFGIYLNSQNTSGRGFLFGANTPSDPTMKLLYPHRTDGFGLKYFIFDDVSPLMDKDDMGGIMSVVGNQDYEEHFIYDARRSHRQMVGKLSIGSGGALSGTAYNKIDAGAVEYTPFRVFNTSTGSNIENVFSALGQQGIFSVNKRTVVFDDFGNNGFEKNINNLLSIPTSYNEYLIINGYSKDGSAVAGPGLDSTSVTPAKVVELKRTGINGVEDILKIESQNVTVSGLSFINSRKAIVIPTGGIATIEGCHIGVNGEGTSVEKNNIGIELKEGGLSIGDRKYTENYQHISRNIITGNDTAVIVNGYNIEFLDIYNNFIGLLSNGNSNVNQQGIGLSISLPYGSVKIGKENNSNYFGNLDKAIVTNNGNISNNYFGFKYNKTESASITNGVLSERIKYDPVKIKDNYFGNIESNAITNQHNNYNTTEIAGNTFGVYPIGREKAEIKGNGILLKGASQQISGNPNYQGKANVDSNIILNCKKTGIKIEPGDYYNYTNTQPSDINQIFIDAKIKYNYIGKDTTTGANTSFGNGVGISISDSIYNVTIDSNTIAKNNGAGIAIDSNCNYIHITKNSIYNNVGLGIDLNNNNVQNIDTTNLPISNNGIIPPKIIGLICDGNSLDSIKLDIRVKSSNSNYKVELFKADSDMQEGYVFIKDSILTTGINGNYAPNTVNILLSGVIIDSIGSLVATITKDTTINSTTHSSTSEFSESFGVSSNIPDMALCIGDEIDLTQYANGGDNVSYYWSKVDENNDEQNNNSTIKVDEFDKYGVTISVDGCNYNDTISISKGEECGQEVINNDNEITTNAFEPGTSGENSTFKIDLKYIVENEPNVVTIYNRWGDIIYKVNNYNNTKTAWDGTNQSGEPMPEASYFYTVEVPSKKFSTNGWVYLDR